jgi:hypothetical protein
MVGATPWDKLKLKHLWWWGLEWYLFSVCSRGIQARLSCCLHIMKKTCWGGVLLCGSGFWVEICECPVMLFSGFRNFVGSVQCVLGLVYFDCATCSGFGVLWLCDVFWVWCTLIVQRVLGLVYFDCAMCCAMCSGFGVLWLCNVFWVWCTLMESS